jgi:hypothetical protein
VRGNFGDLVENFHVGLCECLKRPPAPIAATIALEMIGHR